ncbi:MULTISPECIES: VOC family protein [unclassified Rhodococcus (in: high G+C Gram-positive bacteria)]|uniref:Buprofezin-2,3-diol 1,2-dioxygenase n=1 Tax=Rhodococcus qingshengii TaxID=334542 RepID=A0A221J3F0_RHOSG|nr:MULTISPECIES: VOC family protein [unclassified Rhodococcus (in: high G+C Gram-positive bacteria)]AIW42797.1 2,3-dihydroxybiphenyl 1,2-dioxygenase [Rhodococcus sp. YL-1]ASM60828.1 buprofezin-2,3-diol 1,2-dioxygenase [Rhodococcus qingshengii]
MDYVSSVAYMVAKGPLDEWQWYATENLGMQAVSGDDPNHQWFRMDERAYRLIVEPGESRHISMGLETLTEANLERCVANLLDRGHSAVEDEELAKQRRVRRLVRSVDPSGNGIEVFYGQESSDSTFVSPRGVKFVTGDMGFGHAFLLVDDWKAMLDYYVDGLGFRLSDTIDIAIPNFQTEGIFLHCNARHHSIAFAQIPEAGPRVGHIMLEVDTLDAVGYALDKAEDHGGLLTMTLGKHTNDHMTSFYMQTPSGFEVEYGWEGRTVDDKDWTVGHYSAISNWGHRRVAQATESASQPS